MRRAATLRHLDYAVEGATRALDATVAFLEPEGGSLLREVQRRLRGRREGVLGFIIEQPCGALSFRALGGQGEAWACTVASEGWDPGADDGGW